MRKFLISAPRALVAALLLAAPLAHAQDGGKMAPSKTPAGKMSHAGTTAMNGCTMKDGKMMTMKNGKMTPMTGSVTMSDGSVCTTDGTCQMKDGTKMTMKDGQCLMMNGKMTTMSAMTKGGKMTKGSQMDHMKM